jgi:hypothetical protein
MLQVIDVSTVQDKYLGLQQQAKQLKFKYIK